MFCFPHSLKRVAAVTRHPVLGHNISSVIVYMRGPFRDAMWPKYHGTTYGGSDVEDDRYVTVHDRRVEA